SEDFYTGDDQQAPEVSEDANEEENNSLSQARQEAAKHKDQLDKYLDEYYKLNYTDLVFREDDSHRLMVKFQFASNTWKFPKIILDLELPTSCQWTIKNSIESFQCVAWLLINAKKCLVNERRTKGVHIHGDTMKAVKIENTIMERTKK